MNDRLNYRSVAYLCSLFLIVGLFLQFDNETKQSVFDLIYDLTAITTFTFAYLWLKRRILLIGLVFYGISWNIDLLTNPLITLESQMLISVNVSLISLIFNAIGLLCLLIGFFENFKHDYLTKEIDLNIRSVIGFLIGFTILIQFTIRTII